MNQIERTIAALIKNNMDARFFENIEQLHIAIQELMDPGAVVTMGGSMSLFESKVYDLLVEKAKEDSIVLLDRYQEGLSKEDIGKIYREAFSADFYFTSTNAVTTEGELYNVDGNGNRVAAMIFGPKNVVLIVGVNKIVENKIEAIERVEKVAAPKNARRLKLETPCAYVDECTHCMSEQRMCASYVFLGKQRIQKRIKVFIVNQELGF